MLPRVGFVVTAKTHLGHLRSHDTASPVRRRPEQHAYSAATTLSVTETTGELAPDQVENLTDVR